jgi:YfiH family protein
MNLHPDWIVPDWPAPANVKAFITTRAGGSSIGPYAGLNLGLRTDDDPLAVETNRRRLRAALPGEPKWLRQVHGCDVVDADAITGVPEADAALARSANTVCAVLVADCIPVLLADRAGSVVAIAHAGWRGLARGVLEHVMERLDRPPGELLAYLGPGIGPGAFEVGADVRDAFLAGDAQAEAAFRPRSPGKWMADLFLLARQRLARCGVTRIHGGDLCTHSDPRRFYSYRRDGATGRMAALIWRVP